MHKLFAKILLLNGQSFLLNSSVLLKVISAFFGFMISFKMSKKCTSLHNCCTARFNSARTVGNSLAPHWLLGSMLQNFFLAQNFSSTNFGQISTHLGF
jgi:hypothetical protein